MLRTWILAGFLGVLAGVAHAATVTVTDTAAAPNLEDPGDVEDTMMLDGPDDSSRENDGARNFDDMRAANAIQQGASTYSGYPLVKFVLPSLPGSAILTSASLELYCFNVAGASPRSITVCPVAEDWAVRFACYKYRDGEGTYTNMDWWNPGGATDPEKMFDPAPSSDDYDSSAGATNASIVVSQYNAWDVTTIVGEWLDSTRPNYGFVLVADTWDTEMKFRTVNWGAVTERPKLVIDYTLPTVTITAAPADEQGPSGGSFTISREDAGTGTPLTTDDLVVDIQISGSAVSPDDYSITGLDGGGTSVTIPDGLSSVTVTVTPVDDPDPEGEETVIMEILASAEYALPADPADAEATCTIADNDDPGAFDLVAPGDGTASVPIGSRGSPVDVTFDWQDSTSPDADSYVLLVVEGNDVTAPLANVVADVTLGAATSGHDLSGFQFDYNTEHAWRVTAVNASGETVCTSGQFTFTTEGDVFAPEVTGTLPASAAAGVAVSATVTIYFGEPIASTDLQNAVTVTASGGGAVAGVVSIGGAGGDAFVFTPDSELSHETTYDVVVNSAVVQDTAGPTGMAADYTFFFTTTELPPQVLPSGGGCAPSARGPLPGGSVALLLLACLAAGLRRRTTGPASPHFSPES